MPTTPEMPRPHLAWQLREQATVCALMGSPLYAHLLELAAADVEAGGTCWDVLSAHVLPDRGDAAALRFMAALHRLVLGRRVPQLALHYPSVGGTAPVEEAGPAFRAAVAANVEQLRSLTALHCQTNEVGRAAALVCGFLTVASRTDLPLRVLEVGASAGLNLRWDRFHYDGGGASWGDPHSPVDLAGLWSVPPPRTDLTVTVVERRGCDRAPVDPLTPEGRLALTASVWADQTERFERLRGALRLAAELPAPVDRASLDDWVAARLAEPVAGVATIVYHSVVDEYLPADVRERFHAAVRAGGERASADAPLAWVRLEPYVNYRHHRVTVITWPEGDARVVARCGPHGSDVVWLG